MEDILPPFKVGPGYRDWRYLIDTNFETIRVYTDLFCLTREDKGVEVKYQKKPSFMQAITGRFGKKIEK